MSDETKALAQAIKLNAEANLDLVQELKQGRHIQQQMATTLVQIYEGQKDILEQLQNAHSRARESDGKIRKLDEKVSRHEARLSQLEAAGRPTGTS